MPAGFVPNVYYTVTHNTMHGVGVHTFDICKVTEPEVILEMLLVCGGLNF